MAQSFNLVPETTGEYVDIAALAEKKGVEQRPFTCFLDLGLARATKGARVFAAMKGAVDGGIHIPHKDNIFPSSSNAKVNALRERIFGLHVQKYMDSLKGQEYVDQFKKWDECLKANKVNKVEDLYKKVHAAIRADSSFTATKKNVHKHVRDAKNKNIITTNGKTYRNDYALTNAQRKTRVTEKIQRYLKERQRK